MTQDQLPEHLLLAVAANRLTGMHVPISKSDCTRIAEEIVNLRAGYAAARLEIESLRAGRGQGGYPALPKVGPIGFASVVDIERYAKTLEIGPHLPGVRDVALWTSDQMRAYVDADRAARAQAAPTMDDAIAAGNGTLHGAIDHWQERALEAERLLAAAPQPSKEHAMTDKLRQAAQQALEALGEIHPGNMTPMAEEGWSKATTTLRAALAEPAEAQEPVGRFTGRFWTDDAHNRMLCEVACNVVPTAGALLYTGPATQPAAPKERNARQQAKREARMKVTP